MYAGELMWIQLKYYGENPEPMFDRLSTVKILKEKDGVCLFDKAEVYGKGDDMWVRSQGEDISNYTVE